MKYRFPVILLPAMLLLSGTALATEEIAVDAQALKKSVAITSILDRKARLADDRELGEIKDALLGNEQRIEHFLLDVDESAEYNRGAATFADDVADYGEPPLYESESDDERLNLEYVLLPPGRMRYDASSDAVEFNLGEEKLSALRRSDGPVVKSPRPFASRLIGMEVRLADEESFGSVEDIMLAENGDGVVAYIVDSRDGLEKRRHALPADAARFLRAEKENPIREEYGIEAIQFPYSARQLEQLQEFDLDEHKGNDWNIDIF